MISLEELLRRHTALDRREVVAWVKNRWVLPERRGRTWIFYEVDVARVELICEIRQELRSRTMPCRSSLASSIRFMTCGGSSAGYAMRWLYSRPRSAPRSSARCRAHRTPRGTD